jgi:hypothetical protein
MNRFIPRMLLFCSAVLAGCSGQDLGTPAGSPAMPIELSTGVALAQTLPEGTRMGFSVEYRFAEGQSPDPTAKYVWVLQPAAGMPIRVQVPLKPQGTLETFTPWRPDDGPFQSHLEDMQGDRLSEPIGMK